MSQSRTRVPLKQQQSRRGDRIAKTNDIRSNARSRHIDSIRKRPEMMGSNESPLETWIDVPLAELKMEIHHRLSSGSVECQMTSIETLCRRLYSKSEESHQLTFAIIEHQPTLSLIVSKLNIEPNNLDGTQYHYLMLMVELTDSHNSAISYLIDSGAIGAVHDLLEQKFYSLHSQLRPLLLRVFCNLASNSDLGRLLCFNLDIPQTILKILASQLSLSSSEQLEQSMELAKIISATFVHLSHAKDYYSWNLVLAEYSNAICWAMHTYGGEITTNFAFALADISILIETMSLHELVPIYLERELLASLAMVASFPERDKLVGQIIVRLFCTTDEYIERYLLHNPAIIQWLREASTSEQVELRIYFLNSLSNIAGSRDADAHRFIHNQGYLANLFACLHLDVWLNRKIALMTLTNLVCFAPDNIRDFIATQSFVLIDVLECLKSSDHEMVFEACNIVDALLTHVGGNHDSIVWKTFASHDFEETLRQLYFECDDDEICRNAGSILKAWCDYNDVSDLDGEYDDDEDESYHSSDEYRLPETPLPGQTSIMNWVTTNGPGHQANYYGSYFGFQF